MRPYMSLHAPLRMAAGRKPILLVFQARYVEKA